MKTLSKFRNWNANKKYYNVKCDSCSVLVINGVICHERGCIDAYKDELRECKECGCEFTPENNKQDFCSDLCYSVYNGLNCNFDDEEN